MLFSWLAGALQHMDPVNVKYCTKHNNSDNLISKCAAGPG